MPWTAENFRTRHNKKLSAAKAAKAASMANAMLKNGVPEGVAIATANKHVEGKNVDRKPSKASKRYGHTFSAREKGAELDSVVPQKGPRAS